MKLGVSIRIVVILIVSLMLLLPKETHADSLPSLLTPLDINALVSLEATQNALVVVGTKFDVILAPQNLGMWTGTINDSGWSLSFSGGFNGVPLSMTQTGHSDLAAQRATWSTVGRLGSFAFDGSGSMDFDPTWSETIFGVGIGGLQGVTGLKSGAGGILAGMGSAVVIKLADDTIFDGFTEAEEESAFGDLIDGVVSFFSFSPQCP